MTRTQNRNNIFSIQPFFVQCAAQYYKMTQLHSPVAHFYSFTADPLIEHTHIVPSGCVDILFTCDPSRMEASIRGTVTANTRVSVEQGVTYFGVRYRPGVIPFSAEVSGAELVDNCFILSGYPEWGELTERITEEGEFRKRIELFTDSAFCTDTGNPSPDLANAILGMIHGRSGNLRVHELESEIGYSARYINKVFKEHMGVSPKAYSKFIRFQTLLRYLNNDSGSLVDKALDAGFYDHSHMLRDFKSFTLLNPHQYMRRIDLPVYSAKIIEIPNFTVSSKASDGSRTDSGRKSG